MYDLILYVSKLSLGLIGVMFVLRIMGKKDLAQITPLDFVYALLLGGIIEESLYDETVPVYEMLFNLFFWALIIFVLERFATKSRLFKTVGQGDPVLLIENGKLNTDVMKRNNMDVEEVRMLLRMKDIFSLTKVKYAILEESGQLSVMQYAGEEIPTRNDLDLEYSATVMSYLFVNMGKIEPSALKKAGKDEIWLHKALKDECDVTIEEVFFAEWNEQDGFHIQKYDNKMKNPKI